MTRTRFKDEVVTLSHGSGGKASQQLIDAVFRSALTNPVLDRMEDSALLPVTEGQLAFTTERLDRIGRGVVHQWASRCVGCRRRLGALWLLATDLDALTPRHCARSEADSASSRSAR